MSDTPDDLPPVQFRLSKLFLLNAVLCLLLGLAGILDQFVGGRNQQAVAVFILVAGSFMGVQLVVLLLFRPIIRRARAAERERPEC